jgi:hypothetical protein
MSTVNPQTQPGVPVASSAESRELKIYGHTALFYWWPVWVLGYIMALATGLEEHKSRLAIVPEGSAYDKEANRIVLPPGRTMDPRVQDIKERIHPAKGLGVIFVVVLLIVILITNLPLLGLSSFLAILGILLITVVFALLDWWEKIFQAIQLLSLHMNMGFYIFFSTALLIAWALVFFVYDRMNFWRITPGQITHEYVIGGGQRSYDTGNMAFEHLRDDLFRHWILGFGSGDLVMHPMTGASLVKEELHIHNVLFVGAKLRRIQEMIAEKPA